MLDLARQPVPGPHGARATADVCRQLAADRFVVDGRELSLPMHIADFGLCLQVFPVPTRGLQRLLAGTPGGEQPLQLAQLFPGVGMLGLMAADYRDNPLGNYRECAIAVPMYAPDERPSPILGGLDLLLDRASVFIHAMPVDQEFTTHAGRGLWGYPKFLAQLAIEFGEREAHARFEHDGQLVFAIRTGVSDSGSLSRSVGTLTERDGVLRRTVASFSGKGLSLRPGGALPEIGEDHPLARELRELGLPKRPLCTLSLRNASADFGVAQVFPAGG
jgi:hypothetical protein